MPVESPPKRPKAPTPTVLSLRYLRAAGYRVSIAEHWSEHARRRIDLFGFVDLVAVGLEELLLVQTTTRHNLPARLHKITSELETVKRKVKGELIEVEQANPRRITAYELLRVPGVSIHVHGWPKGERKRPVIHELQLADLEPELKLPF